MQSTAWALFILLINTPFFADIVEYELTDASRRDVTWRATLVVVDWVLYASCDCGAQLITTYPICLNWSLILRFVIQHDLPHGCHLDVQHTEAQTTQAGVLMQQFIILLFYNTLQYSISSCMGYGLAQTPNCSSMCINICCGHIITW